jgi:hypothetical protein
MTTWVLILYVSLNVSDGVALSTVSVPGFPTKDECQAAGKVAKAEFGGGLLSTKSAYFVCVEQTRTPKPIP